LKKIVRLQASQAEEAGAGRSSEMSVVPPAVGGGGWWLGWIRVGSHGWRLGQAQAVDLLK